MMAETDTIPKMVDSYHLETSVTGQDTEENVKVFDNLVEDAHQATRDEHAMTFLQAIRSYPKACAWSAVVTMTIIMDGYDTALMGSLFGFPAFTKKYGHRVGNTEKYRLTGPWQMALGMAVPVGNIFGITLNAILTDRLGHKKVLLGALTVLSGLICIQFFAKNVEEIFIGQILCGVPWGIFTTMAPAYASEVAPLALRSYLETWVVTCWVSRVIPWTDKPTPRHTCYSELAILSALFQRNRSSAISTLGIGQFFSYAVLFSLNKRTDQWAYRIPFGVQWVWPAVIIPLALFCPDSPWFLVRTGQYEKAERTILRLTSAKSQQEARDQAKKALALMIETNKLEVENSEKISYAACFATPSDRRRTEIACVAWGLQVTTGFVISGYATLWFQQAGLSPNDSFKMTLGVGAVHLVGNAASAALSGNYGRRKLFLWGLVLLSSFMFLIGFLSFAHKTKTFGFVLAALYLVWFGIWCLTLGPLPYVINGEVSSTRLRSKTIALARGTYLVLNIVNSIVAPYILNPEYANWGGKTGLLTGGLTALSLVWAFFRLPETGSRTFEELDILFTQEPPIPARLFSKAVIERNGAEIRVTGPHLRSE